MLRKAHMRDVPAIQQLINRYAEKDLMLPVSLVDLYDNEEHQGRGVAKQLTEAVLDEAREFDCNRVFTLTYVPAFFQKRGFQEIDKGELPHKVWADCVKCPKFPDCGEISLAIDLAVTPT
ncbi:MAG: GNAT family N-acetyltransferase [Planctomycetota bacterium]|jgi:amino-acid N-acetyltransferase